MTRTEMAPTARFAATALVTGGGTVCVGPFAVVEDYCRLDTGGPRGVIHLGARTKIKQGVVIRAYNGSVGVGSRSTIGDYSVLHGHGDIAIEDLVIIGPHCVIAASQHIVSGTQPVRLCGETASGVVVKQGAWLGSGVGVADGVCIGQGAVVGMGAVVLRSVPAGHIAIGNPARVSKVRPARGPMPVPVPNQ